MDKSLALRREFGPVLMQLPPTTVQALAPRLRRQLQRFLAALAQVFVQSSPLAILRAGEHLFPEAVMALYPSAHQRPPLWMLHNFFGEPSDSMIRNTNFLPSFHQYRARSDDAFANRAVNLTTLFSSQKHEISHVFDFAYSVLFEPNDLHHQLRAVLYDDQHEAELFVGFYRRRGLPPFSLDDHLLLQLVLPHFLDWFRTVHAIGLAPLGDHALATALDANASPCWLVDGSRVVFANLAARRLLTVPPWVTHPAPAPGVRRVALSPGGHPLTLVLAPEPGPSLYGSSLHESLPPALREVAELASAGQSDKEIARTLGKPVATVRTYLARAYARLGIHGRRELMRGRAG